MAASSSSVRGQETRRNLSASVFSFVRRGLSQAPPAWVSLVSRGGVPRRRREEQRGTKRRVLVWVETDNQQEQPTGIKLEPANNSDNPPWNEPQVEADEEHNVGLNDIDELLDDIFRIESGETQVVAEEVSTHRNNMDTERLLREGEHPRRPHPVIVSPFPAGVPATPPAGFGVPATQTAVVPPAARTPTIPAHVLGVVPAPKRRPMRTAPPPLRPLTEADFGMPKWAVDELRRRGIRFDENGTMLVFD